LSSDRDAAYVGEAATLPDMHPAPASHSAADLL